jgi:hypothetical protein
MMLWCHASTNYLWELLIIGTNYVLRATRITRFLRLRGPTFPSKGSWIVVRCPSRILNIILDKRNTYFLKISLFLTLMSVYKMCLWSTFILVYFNRWWRCKINWLKIRWTFSKLNTIYYQNNTNKSNDNEGKINHFCV